MRRSDIKKRYTDRIALAEEVLGMLLEYLDFNYDPVRPLALKMGIHFNTLQKFKTGKVFPTVKILGKMKDFLEREKK